MQTTHQTAHGQLLDITTAPIGTVDLSKYTEETYMRIVTFKTAFYSFYLPVVCGLLVGGTTSQEAFAVAKDICIEMGRYFQVWPPSLTRYILDCGTGAFSHQSQVALSLLRQCFKLC